MRDPVGNRARYEAYFSFEDKSAVSTAAGFDALALGAQVKTLAYDFETKKKYLHYQYGAGLPLPELARSVADCLLRLDADTRFVRSHGPQVDAAWAGVGPLLGDDLASVGVAAMALTLLPDSADVATLPRLLMADSRAYLFDLLLKAFLPDHALDKKYKADKYQAPWTDPVLRALALAPQQRAAALAAHMKNWCRIMRPWGWKPNLDTAPGKDKVFWHFAYEVALAVCAYDIDDSSFNTHPYYPRDLVEHYRNHIRHTRDAWRAEGVGAGVAVLAPPAPRKADLAKSKRKAIARWIELVCDGDPDATEAVLDAVGTPRKVKDVGELVQALSEQRQAICADLKDDASMAILTATLAEARGMGQFDAPAGPPFGVANCGAALLAFAGWAAARGYCLVGLDNDDDSWNAVLVRAEYRQELHALSTALGIAIGDSGAPFSVD